jgi:diacylglycerol kinase (ATP)
MRAAAIFGLGSSTRDLRAFQQNSSVEWVIGQPAEQESVDAILVFGGDGTVHRHLGALVKLGVPVLIVPAGSGNDFARALGIARVSDSVGLWERFASGAANSRAVDLGLITPLAAGSGREGKPTYFSCVAGVGLDGEVSRRANRMPPWLKAHGGYALSLPGALVRFRPFALRMQADLAIGGGEPSQVERTVIAAVFANAPFYGGGMKVAPRAQMDDGLLDVCLVRAISKLKLLGVFPSVYFGRHLGIDGVEYFPALRARVEPDRVLGVYADGEYVCETPVEIAAARGALRVIVP